MTRKTTNYPCGCVAHYSAETGIRIQGCERHQSGSDKDQLEILLVSAMYQLFLEWGGYHSPGCGILTGKSCSCWNRYFDHLRSYGKIKEKP